MLVQDRSVAPPNTETVSASVFISQGNHNVSRDSKSRHFLVWFREQKHTFIYVLILIVTAILLFLISRYGDRTASFQSQPERLDKSLHPPSVDWNRIPALKDESSPYAKFRSEKWIVVLVSEHPSDSVRKLAKIKGWQLLAIGDSRTPREWALKGSIYLSLEQQARLRLRILDFLQYDSQVRKNVGYLFAIQHGAKKIYDADDRGYVIGGDLGKHFDLELVGEDAKQETLLQYNNENVSKIVVNPYIHFGQRSVWPRGLPLENVGDIAHEEFYVDVFSGKQFIQQGISNGLPDIDSVFYFTRKVNLEPFDITFDEHAPKVALPQGIMAPLNSFNTMFLSPAFWGMMLPVSVSKMASDVLRGYWAQRILWEVGGQVVIYPPTIYRHDKISSYPFHEEKDLHVNVGRLIAFLIAWRSNKHKLFDKILDLSYAMAKEGFWGEQDVKLTVAWLEDLVAVGYQQPRLMSLELDRPRAKIGHGDRKVFVPRRLPSVHLGVEEAGTVSYEIANLIRWRKSFGNVVLIMFCNEPVERTALEWRLLYGRIFRIVVILANQKNVDLVVEKGFLELIYKDLTKIFQRFNSADGFLFLEDNTILNYWNLVQADRTKLWISNQVSHSWTVTSLRGKQKDWYHMQWELLKRVVDSMPAHFQVSYKTAMSDDQSLVICNSDIFYVPRRFVSDFEDLVSLVGDSKIHYKVAVPAFFLAMDSAKNFDPVLKNMVYGEKVPHGNSTSYSARAPAVHPWKVSTEQEFIKLIRLMAEGDPLLMELV